MSEYEAVIDDLGSFGPAQIQVFILVSLFEAPAAWGLLVHPVFAARQMPWSCHNDVDTNITSGISFVNGHSNVTYWSRDNCTAVDLGQCIDIRYSNEYTSIVSEWNLICDKEKIPSLITTLQMVSGVLGSFICGHLADAFGRKRVLIGVYTLFCLSSLWSAFAFSWIMYLVLKMIVGATMSGIMVVNFALTMEFVTPEWRTFCGTVGFWNIGVMSLALIGYLIPNWRYMTLTCALLGLPLLACWWFLHESPRWLLLKGRRKGAEAILQKMAKQNKKPIPDFSRLQAFVEREQDVQSESRKYTYRDLCRNFQMTRTTVVILYMWFVCSCVYYGTTLGAGKLHGNIYLNLFLSGLVEVPGLLLVLIFNNRIGRRKTISILLLTGGLSCLCVLMVDLFGGSDMKWLSTMLALIGKSGVSGAWAAALISSAELFPTVVRNIGMGSSSMAARIGSVAAPLMADLDVFHVSLPYVIYGALGLSCGILCLFLPETLNHPLPDVLPPRECCTCVGDKSLNDEGASLEVITKTSSSFMFCDDKAAVGKANEDDALTGDVQKDLVELSSTQTCINSTML